MVEAKSRRPGPPPQFYIPLNVTLYLCLLSHVLAAAFAPIQDCDETFNYWEPVHYLSHGYGLQTWEYSPEFSIRSWAYIVLHTIPIKLIQVFGQSKTFEFYSLRVLLAIVCACAETKLYSVISRSFNPRIAIFYLMIVLSTPGMFYASVALLPSSFAMYTSTLGAAAFMDWQGGPRTPSGIMWFGIGALLGWPFAGALVIPFVLEELALALIGSNISSLVKRFFAGTVRCLVVLGLQVGIDAFFYRKLVVVPWRIVAYNVFSGKDRGPNIFGTEPWDFYIRNLLLNFNLWFLLAIASAPLLLLQTLLFRQSMVKQTLMRTIVFLTPFYLWLGIFTIQPHKEERFMYPAYPFLALNAAIAFHIVLSSIGTSDPKTLIGKIPAQVKLVFVLLTVMLSINIGFLRILGTVTAYRAPLKIYEALEVQNVTSSSDTVCFGKDWYRFPTSFFLPNGSHAKFVKSEFNGLLPGEYHEDSSGADLFPGTWMYPSGMNDLNQEDPKKYVEIQDCSFLVDTHMPGMQPTEHEPLYALDSAWEKVSCEMLLDTVHTNILARTIWLPTLPIIPPKFQRRWGEHCLLRRNKSAENRDKVHSITHPAPT